MKRIIALILALVCCMALLSCGEKTPAGEATKLSFKGASSYAELKKLDGKEVTINGYMATSSPVDGSFIFLMNLPYQSCPFCKPNTSQLSNTMEVYPKSGRPFEYTTQAIAVTGRLEVAKDENAPFTDLYGYEFNFKIVDAEYRIIKAEELGAKMALWQRIAESDLISELYAMYDYVNFTCAWPTYFVNSYEDADGNEIPGYYLYAADALNYLQKDDAQWNYGYKEGYFEGIVSKIEGLDKTELSDLVENVMAAKALAEKAVAELEGGEYTYELQYVEKFGREDYVYTLNKGAELESEMEALYLAFTDWLGGWEL